MKALGTTLGVGLIILGSIANPSHAADSQQSESPEQLLNNLDAAKSPDSESAIVGRIKSLPPSARVKLTAYAHDKTKSGQKRFRVLKAASLATDEMIKEVGDLFEQDRDKDLRVQLAMEMGRLKYAPFKSVLRKAIDAPNENGFVQVSAAWSLALQGDDHGKKRALSAVTNAEPWRDFAMQALAIMKADDLVPELERCASSATDYWKKNSCRLAKLRILLAVRDRDKVPLLSEAIQEKDYFEVRQWAVVKLADLGTPEAGRALATQAKSKGSPAQHFAAEGLQVGIEKKKWTKADVDGWLSK